MYVYTKEDKIASFHLIYRDAFGKNDYTEEERAILDKKNKNCDVEVSDNKMTSTDCGNKEGEVVNKILNAIEQKTYFDY